MRFLSPLLVLLLVAASSAAPFTHAQQQAPADLKITCAAPDFTNSRVNCGLFVAADTIGAEVDLSIPKNPLTTLSNLTKGPNVSNSAAFFKLETADQGSSVLIQSDFADLTATPNNTAPFAMIRFDLNFASLQQSSLPIVITALFKEGSELHTPTSLAGNQAAFSATSDIPLEIRIDGDGEPEPTGTGTGTTGTTGTGGRGGSSFNYTGTNEPLRQAPGFYCFDDPIDSMTDEEWALVCDAKKRGIVSGNPRDDGTFFYGNQPINRAEAVKIVTLGILRSLGFLSDSQFAAEEQRIRSASSTEEYITYPDIRYETNGEPPWFAVYVNVATQQEIVGGYPHDGTYKAINKINNAESYRVIVETGRVASNDIAATLADNERQYRLTQDWFMKYADTLSDYGVDRSSEYGKFTLRKEFLIYVMELLYAVGL